MKNIKIYCYWDLKFDLYHEKQIELYVDCLPQSEKPKDTIRFILLFEPQEILNLNDQIMIGSKNDFFDHVFTHNEFLLENCSKAHLFEIGCTWIPEYSFPSKEYAVSTLVGSKVYAEGHILRQKLWFKQDRITNIKTNFFLSGVLGDLENYNNNPVLGKEKTPLFDSQFHVCIENTKRKNWFSEKFIDCLRTKTIPIYYGCPNIGDWFNMDGIFMVNNLEEIINTCNNLTENTYSEKLKYVEENFELSKKFFTISDRVENKIKELISNESK